MTSGSRNLLILGFGAITIAAVSTSMSLMIYRKSGDIYLDRSRPGYLPDEDEVTEESENNSTYSFPESGELTATDIDEYLNEFQQTKERLESIPDAYSPAPLSDESLGIPSEFVEDPEQPLQVNSSGF